MKSHTLTRTRRSLNALLASLLVVTAVSAYEPSDAPPRIMENFELRDFRGKSWSLKDAAGKHVVVAFLGVECPLVQLYAKQLQTLQDDYALKGVVVIGVNSNLQDSLAEMASLSRQHELGFAYLKDPGNQIADKFKAERTPEVFLLDPNRVIRYQGRIDDQYIPGRQRPEVKEHYLRDALDELLAGKSVTKAVTEPVGCHIGRVLTPQRDSDVTYSNQIARIFQKRCVECHRSGEIGPFPLTSYAEAVGWAEMVDEVTHERRMPPWHATDGHQVYANDARLTDEELSQIREWVDAGAPEGDPGDLPTPREFETGWRIGKPDKIIWMSETAFPVPAQGEVKYQYFTVDPGFTEDMWIQAAECRPGARAVVHHILVGLHDGNGSDGVHGRKSQWLAATAPGAMPMILPKGQAKLIPAGSKLVFQMHYTPNGTATTDRSSIGLIFADRAEVVHRVATHQAANPRVRIPPNAANHRENASYTFQADGYLRSMFPHMHLRGKAFRYTAHYPNGKEEVLLDVPNYDFNWQNAYVLSQPKRMPKGTQIKCEAYYDNSYRNIALSDDMRSSTVRCGDQTDEEMMIGYFDVFDADDGGESPRTTAFLNTIDSINRALLITDVRQSLTAAESFSAFGKSVRDVMDQVDRVDWITVSDQKMHVEQIAQDAETRRLTTGKMSLNITGMHLPRIAAGNEVVAFADLRKAPGADMRFMAKNMGSSVHIPMEALGEQGVLSVWSAEKNAFPEPVIELLKAMAASAAKR